MKLRIITLLALSLFISATTVKAQIAYPRFQKHMVLEGETAQSIADHFQVSLEDFCLLNDFPQNVKLKTNQVVLVKQLKDGEEEIVEDVPLKKKAPAKTITEEKPNPVPEKTAAEEKPTPVSAKTVTEEKPKAAPAKTTTVVTEKPKPVAEEKTKPAPVKSTAEVEKPKPAPAPVKTKKEVAEEPFVVPPPSTKAVEVGPHGVKYNVSHTGYHIVAKNQTFFRIALIYGMSVDELKEMNGLSNTTVEIGQKLKVRK